MTWRSLVQAAQPVAQLDPHLRVERAERLVEQQHLRLDRQRARERHPLPLPARQLRRVALAEAVELDQRQELGDLAAPLLLRHLADAEPEGDVRLDGHVLEERVALEHEAEAALLGRQARHVGVAEQHLAGVGLLEPGDHPQHRRLPRPRRPEQRGDAARRRDERDVRHRRRAGGREASLTVRPI